MITKQELEDKLVDIISLKFVVSTAIIKTHKNWRLVISFKKQITFPESMLPNEVNYHKHFQMIEYWEHIWLGKTKEAMNQILEWIKLYHFN